jgi:hypothetical protein
MDSPEAHPPSGDASATNASKQAAGKACPSAPCTVGALLVGVMTESGRLAYVQPPTRIDSEFVANAQAKGRPESRFRFSLPCIEAACPQWSGSGCGLGDMLIEEHSNDPPTPTRLPACAVRHTCRWFAEHAAQACAICPSVVADVGGTETYRSLTQARSPKQQEPPNPVS